MTSAYSYFCTTPAVLRRAAAILRQPLDMRSFREIALELVAMDLDRLHCKRAAELCQMLTPAEAVTVAAALSTASRVEVPPASLLPE